MSKPWKKIAMVLASPLLSATLLAGMMAEHRSHVKPTDVEPFHARAKAAVESLPWFLGDWTGQEHKIPREAVAMLRPNSIKSRGYSNPSKLNQRGSEASLLLVQTKDIRDMLGHYPPVCYPGVGWVMKSSTARDWKAGSMTIQGTEYMFESRTMEGSARHSIYNFMIVPGVGFVRDMDGVMAAAESYQRRYYGASQFQIIMSGDLTTDERDQIFSELIGPLSDMIAILMNETTNE